MWASRDQFEPSEKHIDLWNEKPSREDWYESEKLWQWKGDGWAGQIEGNPLGLRKNQCVEIQDIRLALKVKTDKQQRNFKFSETGDRRAKR